ncbi:hypothetical protein BC936DRAFT_140932 [Jimgerdemannia flammicorona]|uniref:Uncharacterized protein n=1 Tax=Jimgerdemannia flammicorona TaxID=994334 RepID=A0A433A380_9FUNG|nr:hypothetical protein BC936DRAFT_140932 [Jimgerdemannia flammicorona]
MRRREQRGIRTGKTVSKGTKTEGYAKKGLPTKKSRTTGQKSLGPKKVEEITTRAPAESPTLIVRLKIPVRPPAIKEPIVVVARSNKRKDAPAPSKSGKPNEQRERAEENDTEPTPAIASGNPKLMLKLPSQKKRDRPVVESDEEGEVSQEDKKRLKSNRELSSKQAKPKKLMASSGTKSAPSPSPTAKDLKRKRVEEYVDTTLKRKRADEAESATEDAPPRKTLVTKRENTSSPGSAGTPPAARLKDNGHEKGQKGKPFSRSPSRERETGRRDEEKRASGKSSLAKEGGPKNNTKTSLADRRDEIRKEKMASERTARRSMSPSLERSVSPVMRQAPRGKGGDKEKEREGKGDGARTGKDKEKEKDKEKDKGARRSSCRSWSRDRGRSRSRSPRRDRERDRERGRGRDADRDRRERDRDNRGRRRSRDKSRDRSRERSKEREKGARDGSRERERVGRLDREKDKDGRKLDKEKDRVSPVTNTGADRRSSIGVGSGARRRTEGENSLVKEETPRKMGSIPLGSKNTANDMMTPPPHQPSSAHHDDKAVNNTTPQNPASNAHDVRSGSATATAPNTLSVPSTPSRKLKVTLAELKKQRADQGTTPAPIAGNGHETDSSGNTPKDIESPAPGHPRTPAPSTLPVGAELEHDVSQAQPRTSLAPDSAASPSEVRVKKEGVQTPASSQGNVPKDYIDKWRIAGVRYRELGDNYKHQGDKSSGDKSSQASEELASVQWMEGVLSYLQSFYYVELANEQNAIKTWESLMPFLNFVKKKQWVWKQWPLFGLCCKIESIVLFHIFSLKEVQFKRRTSRIATTLRSHDTTVEDQRLILVEHLDTIAKLFEEFEHVGTRWSESETHLTHEVLRRDFPETWQKCCIEGDVSVGAFEMEGGETAQRFEWPMTHFTGVPRLVAFGRCLLRELVIRKGISFVPIKDF